MEVNAGSLEMKTYRYKRNRKNMQEGGKADLQDHNGLGMSEHGGLNLNEVVPLQNSKIYFKIFPMYLSVYICQKM